SAAFIAAQQHLAEILEAGVARIGKVADRGADDLGVVRAGESEKLVDLVAADIGEDSAAFVALEEPGWAQVAVEPGRAEGHGLHHAADRARRDKLERAGNRRRLEAPVARRP